MKHSIKKTIASALCLVLGLMIAIGLSYVHAGGTWNDAPTNPPQNNTPFPVTAGAVTQYKGESGSAGGLSVNEFSAAQNAQFDAVTAFRGLILGAPDASDPYSSSLAIGDSNALVHMAIGGKEYTADDGLYSDKVITGGGMYQQVCSDASGNIILCVHPKPMDYNAKITAFLSPVWDDAYKGNRLLYKDWWHAPLRLIVVSPKALPDVSFKWGYCHTYNNAKNNNYEHQGGWFPPSDTAGDHPLPGQCVGFPEGFPNLPYTVDSYCDPRHDCTYYGPGKNYSGTAAITNGSTYWSGMLARNAGVTGYRSTWDEKFDSKGKDTTRYGQVTKIIIYDVSVPPGYTLDVRGIAGGVPVEVR